MKKKAIIISSVVVGLIGLLILLSFTLFSLKEVSIDYRTSKANITLTDKEIIEKGNFKYGGSVFFHGKKYYTENIEKANPYIKVVNIETVFPSSFVIHIAERQEIYAVKHGEEFLLCDDEFKVLKKSAEFTSDETNAILLDGIKIQNQEVEVGDFLNVSNYVNIYPYLYELNYNLGQQTALIKQVKFNNVVDDKIKENQLQCVVSMFNGQTFSIENCTYGLFAKVKMMVEVYSQSFNFIGKEITLEDKTKHILTEEDLKTCTFIINNFYNYQEHGEKDCYFDIKLAQK